MRLINKAIFILINKFWDHSNPGPFQISESIVQNITTIEEQSMAQARKSLQMGFNDLTYILQDLPSEQIRNLNEILTHNSYPNWNRLLASIKNSAKKIIKRGKIKNQEEYFLLKEIDHDLENELNITEKELIKTLIVAFENN